MTKIAKIRTLSMSALAAATAAFASPAEAQSFDCRDSTVKAERAVCGSDRLSDLDERMSSLYDSLIASTPGPRGREQVRSYQRQFLAARNACGRDTVCIKGAYEDQISVLRDRVRPSRYE